MRSLGQILAAARLSQNLSVKQVAEKIKLKERLVESIEKDDFSGFAGEVYAAGFVTMYADLVNLKREIVMPYFRKSWSETGNKNDQNTNFNADENYHEIINNVEKNAASIITTFGVMIIIIAFIFFLLSQYFKNIKHL